MEKNLLVLKATHDICGNEIGLIENQCCLLEIGYYQEDLDSLSTLQSICEKYDSMGISFDYVYLCTHANVEGFDMNVGGTSIESDWHEFSKIICKSKMINADSIFLLACCRGGIFQVATDLMAICSKINYVCGAIWTLEPWDLTTGFTVFIYNLEKKNAEPSYASKKASQATDFTFRCYDRAEIESTHQFNNRQNKLFSVIGWDAETKSWITPISDKEVLSENYPKL